MLRTEFREHVVGIITCAVLGSFSVALALCPCILRPRQDTAFAGLMAALATHFFWCLVRNVQKFKQELKVP